MSIKAIFCGSILLSTSLTSLSQDLYLQNSFQQILYDALSTTQTNPGVIMKIHVPGQWVWQGASGYAVTGNTAGFPATNANGSEQFRCGSVSKIFVATSIMQLHENGLLELTDSIGKYLRTTLVQDTIQSSSTVTISQLLNHSDSNNEIGIPLSAYRSELLLVEISTTSANKIIKVANF